MSRLRLTDTFQIDGKIKKTGDGYLAADARVARTGIQLYKGHEVGRPDMDTVRVYRPSAEVFNKDTMKSCAHRPVTFLHPPVTVSAKNWKQYAIGHTTDPVVRDGDYIRVPVLMMDAAAINSYEKEGIKELSLGYSTDLKWEPGKTNHGEPYDAVQTDIRVNHLAVVPTARGGAELRIGDKWDEDPDDEDDDDDMDDAMPYFHDREFSAEQRKKAAKSGAAMPGGGYPIENEQDLKNAIHAFGRAKDPAATKAHIKTRARALGLSKLIPENWDSAPSDEVIMKSIVVDGVAIEVEDRGAVYLEKHLNTLTQALADAKGKLDKAAADDEEEEEEETRAQDAIRKAFDALTGERDALKKQLSDATDPAKIDALVAEKAAVASKAKSLLGDKFVADGKTSEQIRKEVVDAKMGDAAKDWSADRVAGCFDGLQSGGSSAPAKPQTYGYSTQTNQHYTSGDANAGLKQSIADAASRFSQNGTMNDAEAQRDAAFAELEKRSQNAWRTLKVGGEQKSH